jgi:hypothetical protein
VRIKAVDLRVSEFEQSCHPFSTPPPLSNQLVTMIRQNSPAAKSILPGKHESSVSKTAFFGFFPVLLILVSLVLAVVALIPPVASQVSSAETALIGLADTIVADPQTGLALFGYDPVAYFVDHKAEPGLPAFETLARGFAWRFVNQGNRTAFEGNPDLYIPQFGGYDAALLARNKLAAGDPKFFAVIDNVLVLFRSERTRARFLSDRGELPLAVKNWQQLRRDLSRAAQ